MSEMSLVEAKEVLHLPDLADLNIKAKGSVVFLTTIEEKLAELVQDPNYSKDGTFLLDCHSTVAKNVVQMYEANRKLLDTTIRFLGVMRPSKKDQTPEGAPAPATPGNAANGPKVTDEELASSSGNSKFGNASTVQENRGLH